MYVPLPAVDEDGKSKVLILLSTRVQVFACTVGQKPSKAPYYVNDPEDVLTALHRLAESSIAGERTRRNSVTFAVAHPEV